MGFIRFQCILWQRQDLNPQPPNLIHGALDHRTTVPCPLIDITIKHSKIFVNSLKKNLSTDMFEQCCQPLESLFFWFVYLTLDDVYKVKFVFIVVLDKTT